MSAPKTRPQIEVAIADLRRWPTNYNTHPDEQIDALSESLSTFGQYKNVVVYRVGGQLYILAGHGLVEAAAQVGHTHVQAQDWSDLTETEAEALLVSDNETARMAVPDMAKLVDIARRIEAESPKLAELAAGCEERLNELLKLPDNLGAAGMELGEIPDPQMGRAEELLEKWGVTPGDVWEIPSKAAPGGVHRVVCGDCTDSNTVNATLAGELVSIVATDPPYGQSWISNHYGPNSSSQNPMGKIAGDDQPRPEMLEGWIDAIGDLGAAYICTRWKESTDWITWVSGKLRVRNLIVWHKNNWSAGDLSGAYSFMYEQVIFASRDGGHVLRGNRIPDVWEIDRVRPEFHPTTKPIDLFVRMIEKSTDYGHIVADPFLGSGTTIVACEQTGRLGRGVEIEPRYVAVTLERLAKMGLEPRRA